MSKAVKVRCRDCNKVIPMDTGYRFTVCDCYDDTKHVETGEVFTLYDGREVPKTTYEGPDYIAVDGGSHYVRFIGEPEKFIYLDENDNEVEDA